MIKKVEPTQLFFAKTNPNAIIPHKNEENAGYDCYTCETETIIIPPLTTRMVDTGIAIACHESYFIKFFDRGSWGSKGIIVGAGVGDSGYRNSYFVPLINTNIDKWVIITNQTEEEVNDLTHFNLSNNKFEYIFEEAKIELYDSENNLLLTSDSAILDTHNIIFKENCIIKYLKNAITQFTVLPVPKFEINEINWEELKQIESKRGLNNLGSTDN